MKQFFRNNLIKSLGLFFLFGIVNVLLMIGIIFIFIITDNPSSSNTVSFTEVQSSINGSEAEKIKVRNRLKEQDSFYFLIDPNGNIISKEFLPTELNHNYSRADIASFSRWYLDDYPVNTKILDNGNILVIGNPKGSYLKYSFTYRLKTFYQTIFFFPILLFLNFIFFLILFWYQQNKVRKEVEPIITGIEDLAEGKRLSLNTSGQLGLVKSELNKTSELLEKKEQDRVEWISGVSHDIRTPLTSILASSELIETNEQNKEYVGRIQKNVVKIKDLVESLNLNNKLYHGKAPINKEYLNLTELFRNSIIQFINNNDVDSELVEVDISPETEEFYTLVDPFLFDRLVGNLLDNWLSHNRAGTQIKLRTFKDVNVNIFEGVNLINPVEDDGSHYGMGLKLVEQICKLHGWQFEIESGSEFKFRIMIKQ